MEAQLSRLADELAQGRQQSTSEIQAELKALTRSIEARAEGAPGG
jgi:hypothetical protein